MPKLGLRRSVRHAYTRSLISVPCGPAHTHVTNAGTIADRERRDRSTEVDVRHAKLVWRRPGRCARSPWAQPHTSESTSANTTRASERSSPDTRRCWTPRPGVLAASVRRRAPRSSSDLGTGTGALVVTPPRRQAVCAHHRRGRGRGEAGGATARIGRRFTGPPRQLRTRGPAAVRRRHRVAGAAPPAERAPAALRLLGSQFHRALGPRRCAHQRGLLRLVDRRAPRRRAPRLVGASLALTTPPAQAGRATCAPGPEG